ncbi:MAG TPA: hypothetical protein PKD12_19850 [Nitrospira sp.]|nr:hypothetical protein [Nitrospira sp.]
MRLALTITKQDTRPDPYCLFVGPDGTVLKRYAPSEKPEMIKADLATRL